MRLLPLIALLPALSLAENAFQHIFNDVKERVNEFMPNSIPNPIDAGASKVAAQKVERINIRNFQRKLAPKLEGEEEWMIYFTGGNKSCFGRCGEIDVKWNESVPILSSLSARPDGPTLRLGKVDCEKESVLCTALSAGLPTIWHFLVPSKDSPKAKTPLHIIPLNITTTTVGDITSIPSTSKSRYLEFTKDTSSTHPIDGWLAQAGLLVPLGYLLWGLGSTPSWVMMVVVSFVSRQIMSKRMGGAPSYNQRPPEPPAPIAGASPPPAARGGSSKGKMADRQKKKN